VCSSDLAFARRVIERHSGIVIGAAEQLPQVFVEF
jgi:hypothetical protein